MTTYGRTANRLTLILFIALVGLSIAGAIGLHDPIPIHFNGSGQPNRWGSPTTLLILPLVCGGMLGLFWAIVRYTPTELMNIPGPRTPENMAKQRQYFNQFMATVRALVAGLFLGILCQLYWVSIHHQNQAVMWPSFLFIALLFSSTLFYLIRAYKLVPPR